MINNSGHFNPANVDVLSSNRAFLFGDAVFETMKIVDGKILFLEDHYFRLMASMRIIRMEIPMHFTMEFFESEILKTAEINNFADSVRARITVYRNSGGLYTPATNSISYLIEATSIENKLFQLSTHLYEVDLFKDYFIPKHLLSTLKTTNKLINIVGSVYAKENDLQNCLLLNDSKNVVEALNGNLFMFLDGKLITPPLSEGCLNGIMRRQILKIAKKIDTIEVLEAPISPFDLQKADELFITNSIVGIIRISKYRKKEYKQELSDILIKNLNLLIAI